MILRYRPKKPIPSQDYERGEDVHENNRHNDLSGVMGMILCPDCYDGGSRGNSCSEIATNVHMASLAKSSVSLRMPALPWLLTREGLQRYHAKEICCYTHGDCKCRMILSTEGKTWRATGAVTLASHFVSPAESAIFIRPPHSHDTDEAETYAHRRIGAFNSCPGYVS